MRNGQPGSSSVASPHHSTTASQPTSCTTSSSPLHNPLRRIRRCRLLLRRSRLGLGLDLGPGLGCGGVHCNFCQSSRAPLMLKDGRGGRKKKAEETVEVEEAAAATAEAEVVAEAEEQVEVEGRRRKRRKRRLHASTHRPAGSRKVFRSSRRRRWRQLPPAPCSSARSAPPVAETGGQTCTFPSYRRPHPPPCLHYPPPPHTPRTHTPHTPHHTHTTHTSRAARGSHLPESLGHLVLGQLHLVLQVLDLPARPTRWSAADVRACGLACACTRGLRLVSQRHGHTLASPGLLASAGLSRNFTPGSRRRPR